MKFSKITNSIFARNKPTSIKPSIQQHSYSNYVVKKKKYSNKGLIKKIENWDEYLDNVAKKTVYGPDAPKEKRGKPRPLMVKTRSVDVIYKTSKGPFKAIKNISLNLFQGEIIGLVGETGSGKSTFGKALTKQVNHLGSIVVDGLTLPNKVSRVIRSDVTKRIQMIFQDPTDSLNPYRSVGRNLIEGLYNIVEKKSFFEKKAKKLMNSPNVLKMISSVGFDDSLTHMFPLELSGGQQQRVSIARALLVNPKVLVADEPISALDVSIQAQVINILRKLKRERDLSILFIAHDLRMVEYVSTRILVINQGRIVEIIPSQDINNKAIHPYTQTLLSAVPSIDEFDVNLLRKHHDPLEYIIFEDTCWWEVGKEHYVFGTEDQVLRWIEENESPTNGK